MPASDALRSDQGRADARNPRGIPYPDPVSVKAWLEGHQFDLDKLVELFREGPTRVSVEDGKYYLVEPTLDQAVASNVPLIDAAPPVLRRVNGLAAILWPDYKPVSLTLTFFDGKMHHVYAQETIHVRDAAMAVVTGP